MFKFFASMRRMLAREFANVVLGAIAQDAIQRLYLPEIKKAIKKAPDGRKKEALQEQLAEWEKYSDPRKNEAGIWNANAAKIVRSEVKNNNRGEDDVDEVASVIGEEFLKNPRMLASTFGKFDPLKAGVKDVLRVWNRAVGNHAKTVLRTWATEERKMQRGDEDYDPLQNLPSAQQKTEVEEELDKRTYQKLERDLVRFMGKALRDDVSKMLFKEWHKVAKKKGPDKVTLKKDVYPVLWDKGVTVKENRLSELWRDITRILVMFWETPADEGGAGVRVPDKLKQKLRVSMVSRIAEDAWRERVCSWMLAVVPGAYRRA
jgi:hypothetical protein